MLGIVGSLSSKSKSKSLRIKPIIPSISASDFTVGGNCTISVENISSSKAILSGSYVIINLGFSPGKGVNQNHEHKAKISRKSIERNSIKITFSPSNLTTTTPVSVNVSLVIVSRGIESDIATTTCTLNPKGNTKK